MGETAAVAALAAPSTNEQVPHFNHLLPVLLSSREGETAFLFIDFGVSAKGRTVSG